MTDKDKAYLRGLHVAEHRMEGKSTLSVEPTQALGVPDPYRLIVRKEISIGRLKAEINGLPDCILTKK